MSYALAIALHQLAAVVWVGGMFFAYLILRPVAAAGLEPPPRLRLWLGVFDRFLPWVWAAVILLLISGYWLVFSLYGGFVGVGVHVHLMQLLGILMMLLFFHLFFAPYRRLKQTVRAEDWPAAGAQLGRIRTIVGVNLILGLLVVAIGSSGRYWVLL